MSKAHIGYAAMLEQFHPTEVVELSALAERAGFTGVMAADHFQPWVPQQGQAAFVWNVLTALGERTQGDMGPGVTCPAFRFHPALVAQGKELYDKGVSDRGIPACATCHGANAEGVADFPRLAGQHAKYVAKQLNYIQSLVRAAPVMHGIVKDMTPAEILAVAAYVQSR